MLQSPVFREKIAPYPTSTPILFKMDYEITPSLWKGRSEPILVQESERNLEAIQDNLKHQADAEMLRI